MIRTVRPAAAHLIQTWVDSGDFVPRRELIADAFLHLRWRLEKGASLADALAAMMKATPAP